MVGLGRFELPTSPLSGVRSSQLSYRPGIAARAFPSQLASSGPAAEADQAPELTLEGFRGHS